MNSPSAVATPLAAAETQSVNTGVFAQALRSGIHRVIEKQDNLNRINVFPVADSDTGTNLSLSLSATLHLLDEPGEKRLAILLAAIADAMLDGARGNSGAIMAQFFQGMSDSSERLSEFDSRTFASAVALGSEYAHDAIADPQPGTILSVIAAFAEALRNQLNGGNYLQFRSALKNALEVAETALARTESQLEVLRKAGVVDAGAKGFVLLLAGMTDVLIHGRETDKPDIADVLVDASRGETVEREFDLQFRYCTECLITGHDIDRRKLREALSELGNSLVIAGTKRKAKIHIHVNDPDTVFETVRRFGSPSGEKADDMRMQQHGSHSTNARFAVITDSAADISDEDLERLDIHVVPARIQFGDRGYLDKVSITPEEFFNEVQRNPAHPTTSQPAPGDFRRQFQFLASHFPDVISINLTATVSGTCQAAHAAASRVSAAGNMHVIDSLNVSVGQGLLTAFVANCASAGIDVSTTLAALDDLITKTRSFALIDDLSYAVRGGRVSGYVKRLAGMLRITPVLGTLPDGRIAPVGILPGRGKTLPRFARFIASRVARENPMSVSIGHALCEGRANRLKTLLQQHIRPLHGVAVTELGSAFGVHGGPGTIVVGVAPHVDAGTLRAK